MQNMFRISLILFLIITCFLFTASCAKKKVEPDLSFDEAARLEELERQLSLEEERLAAAAEEAEREMIAAREMLMDEDI